MHTLEVGGAAVQKKFWTQSERTSVLGFKTVCYLMSDFRRLLTQKRVVLQKYNTTANSEKWYDNNAFSVKQLQQKYILIRFPMNLYNFYANRSVWIRVK